MNFECPRCQRSAEGPMPPPFCRCANPLLAAVRMLRKHKPDPTRFVRRARREAVR